MDTSNVATERELIPPPHVDEEAWWAGIISAAGAMRDGRGRFAKRYEVGSQQGTALARPERALTTRRSAPFGRHLARR